jgi:hypothetical protein
MGQQELDQFDADALPGYDVRDLTFEYPASALPDVDDRTDSVQPV